MTASRREMSIRLSDARNRNRRSGGVPSRVSIERNSNIVVQVPAETLTSGFASCPRVATIRAIRDSVSSSSASSARPSAVSS